MCSTSWTVYSCDIFDVQARCHMFRCSEIFRHKAGNAHSHVVAATIKVAEEVSIKYVCIYPIKIGTLEQNRLEPLWLLGLSLFQSCSDPYRNLGLVPKFGRHDSVPPRTCPGDYFCFCNNVFVALAWTTVFDLLFRNSEQGSEQTFMPDGIRASENRGPYL